jgi:hypothetical protein
VIAKAVTTKVIVQEPFRIVHESNAYTAGDEITVDTAIAATWERAGGVRRSPAPTSQASSK